MGANNSKQEVLNETLNKIQIDVMTKNSSSANSSTVQSNVFRISNNTGNVKVNNFSQENISKINLSSLTNSKNNANLQAELISKIKQAAEQEAPSIALGSTADQTIKNSISNIISTSMSIENLSKLAANVNQSNVSEITNNSGDTDASNLKFSNATDIIMSLVNSTSSEVVQVIKAVTDVDSSNTQKQAGILPDFGQMAIIAIVIIAALFLGGGQVFSKSLETITKPVPMAFAAMIVLIIVYIVFSQPKPKVVEKKPETFLSGMQKRSYLPMPLRF